MSSYLLTTDSITDDMSDMTVNLGGIFGFADINENVEVLTE